MSNPFMPPVSVDKKVPFYKLPEGKSLLRILSAPLFREENNVEKTKRLTIAYMYVMTPSGQVRLWRAGVGMMRDIANIFEMPGNETTIPWEYDLEVVRSGTGKDTRYVVTAIPERQQVPPAILTELSQLPTVDEVVRMHDGEPDSVESAV